MFCDTAGLHVMADVLVHGNNSVVVKTWPIDVDEDDVTLKRKLIAVREQRVVHNLLICRPSTLRKVFNIVSDKQRKVECTAHLGVL